MDVPNLPGYCSTIDRRHERCAMITKLIGNPLINRTCLALLGATHAVPAIPQRSAICLIMLIQGHKISDANIHALAAANAFLSVNIGWHNTISCWQ